jgi:proline iminopeptidase
MACGQPGAGGRYDAGTAPVRCLTVPVVNLYPETPARRSLLSVSGGHVLQLYEWGDPHGQPALLLHGGPGSGLSPSLARCLNPQHYRIIGLDQRGAGRSTPSGGIAHNGTAELLADLRLLREHLGIARWLVVGGSWGATLALLHAADTPAAVTGLLLRGVFLARQQDVDDFFAVEPPGFGAAWQPWRDAAVRAGRPWVEQLDHWMQHGTPAEQAALAQVWWRFEQAMDGPVPSQTPEAATLLARYRVQAHFLRHGCGLRDTPLLQRLAALPVVPTLLLHGAEDRICPLAGAVAVQAGLPHARLRLVELAGHAPTHPALTAALLLALANFAAHGQFDAVDAADPVDPVDLA